MKQPSQTRVIVGMSGGVDSSVSALILLQQGYQVEGLFMKNWEEDDGSEYCTAKQDLSDAQSVCGKLGIILHQANFAAEYWDNVFEHFLQEYQSGRTPNPDILCNKEIKFKAFLNYAGILGADLIATGHYARKRVNANTTLLCKGIDTNKDQSYFLHAISHDQVAKTLFPLGELTKPEVRELAKQHGLITFNKKDSTGICFIGERRFKEFLQQYLPARPGIIETTEGSVIGEHSGLMYHTLGQRQGLGIGGLKNANDEPWYVVDKDIERNTLIVAQGNNHPRLFSEALTTASIDWISGIAPQMPCSVNAKVRYRQQDQECYLEVRDESSYLAHFKIPQRAVTPGQSVVFYENDICLGGGVIQTRHAHRANIRDI